jgi:hypothetical protein
VAGAGRWGEGVARKRVRGWERRGGGAGGGAGRGEGEGQGQGEGEGEEDDHLDRQTKEPFTP